MLSKNSFFYLLTFLENPITSLPFMYSWLLVLANQVL